MLKWRHHVTSQGIQDFLEVFFQYKMRYLVVSKKKNPLFVWGWDRKIRPSWSPFVITWQASWCQSVILGTDFSIPPSHPWCISYNIYSFMPKMFAYLNPWLCLHNIHKLNTHWWRVSECVMWRATKHWLRISWEKISHSSKSEEKLVFAVRNYSLSSALPLSQFLWEFWQKNEQISHDLEKKSLVTL